MSTTQHSPQSVALVLETSDYLRLLDAYQLNLFNQKFQNSLDKTIHQGNGRILEVNDASCRAIFPSASSAIFAAHKIHDDFKYVTPRIIKHSRRLHLALSLLSEGEKNPGSQDTLFKELTRICEYIRFDFVITSEVRLAYRKENRNALIDEQLIYVLAKSNRRFFNALMGFMEKNWTQSAFSRKDLAEATGYSVSQCSRKVKKLTGKTPFAFLKEYRLRKALRSLHDSRGEIIKIARTHGFKSGTHFTRSFQEAFGILPSKYTRLSG